MDRVSYTSTGAHHLIVPPIVVQRTLSSLQREHVARRSLLMHDKSGNILPAVFVTDAAGTAFFC
jgi:hypothetical protein